MKFSIRNNILVKNYENASQTEVGFQLEHLILVDPQEDELAMKSTVVNMEVAGASQSASGTLEPVEDWDAEPPARPYDPAEFISRYNIPL